MTTVSMTVNGSAVSADVEDRTLLVDYIRENLRLTGTHVGCDTSQCGACVVHVNGKACAASMVQAFTALPFTCTTHAPHWLVSQPTWVPVSRRLSRI